MGTEDVDQWRADSLRSDKMHLIVMPTEKCNFRCTYCYETFDIGRMKPNIVNGVKSLLAKRAPNLSSLHIGWFGGEPTLCIDIIEEINSVATTSINADATFTSSICTNGSLLTTHNFARLTAQKIELFQISIDGTRVHHDKTRITRAEVGTYDQILSNICNAMQTDKQFTIALRVHVHEKNLLDLPELIDELANRFKGDPRLKVYFKAIEPLGAKGDATFSFLTNSSAIRELQTQARKARIFEDRAAPLMCYAAMANSLVIRADGRVAKCTVAFQDDRNTVGQLTSDGTIQIDSKRFNPWIRGALNGDIAAMECPLHGLQPSVQILRRTRVVS